MTRRGWHYLQARQLVRRELTEVVEVWRSIWASDGRGGRTETSSRITVLAGKVEPPTQDAVTFAERAGYTASAMITLSWDAPVAAGDELRVGSHRYRVVGTTLGATQQIAVQAVVAEAI